MKVFKVCAVGASWIFALSSAVLRADEHNILRAISNAPSATAAVSASFVHTDVLTYKNNLARTGQNLTESLLTPQNVISTGFGLLRVLPADGDVYAEPLYISQLVIAGTAHNVVIVVTEHNSAYAYDADSGTQLWKVTLSLSGETTSDDRSCHQISPEMGVTATPVVDRTAGSAGAIYLVAMSRDSSGGYHQRLHALDATTGQEMFAGPQEILATYPTGVGTQASFDPAQYKERAALLLLNGEIYTTWASHCDNDPYTGWIIAYDHTTLAQTRVLNIAPNSKNLGPAIWMSGGGPAADPWGHIFIATANGIFETKLNAGGFPNLHDYGNSFLKISTANQTLRIVDYFTMWNEVSESQADLDLGGGGVLLLPNLVDATGTVKLLAVMAGKDGNIYVVDRASLGKFNSSRNNIWQELDGALSEVRSTPAYFNKHVYWSGRDIPMQAYTITNAKLSASPTSQSPTSLIYPGGVPIVSAHGNANGIVWAAEFTDNTNTSGNAVLHAYDAKSLATELYNSNQAANGRDHYGLGTKFACPTVADGKVFIGSKVGVGEFGLLH